MHECLILRIEILGAEYIICELAVLFRVLLHSLNERNSIAIDSYLA